MKPDCLPLAYIGKQEMSHALKILQLPTPHLILPFMAITLQPLIQLIILLLTYHQTALLGMQQEMIFSVALFLRIFQLM